MIENVNFKHSPSNEVFVQLSRFPIVKGYLNLRMLGIFLLNTRQERESHRHWSFYLFGERNFGKPPILAARSLWNV